MAKKLTEKALMKKLNTMDKEELVKIMGQSFLVWGEHMSVLPG